MNARSERLVLTVSRWRLGAAAVACLLGLLLGLWFIGEADDGFLIAWSWVGVALLGLGIIAGLWQMRRPDTLTLSPEGFEVTGLIGSGLIPWRDVESFFIYSEPPDIDGNGGVPPHAAWRLRENAPARESGAAQLHLLTGDGVHGTAPRLLKRSPEAVRDLLESWRVRYS